MLKELIEFLLSLKQPEVIEVDGRPYVYGGYVKAETPEPPLLSFSTLTGLADYCQEIFKEDSVKVGYISRKDPVLNDTCAIVIESPTSVKLYGPIFGPFNQRTVHARAKIEIDGFNFGKQYDQESFLIALQANFEKSETLLALMKICSTVSDIREMTADDDGISQEIVVRSGVVTKGSVKVENPISLTPYRTFHEAVQPAGLFVFRMKKSGDSIYFSLHEADGGAWRNKAILNIKDFLESCGLTIKVLA